MAYTARLCFDGVLTELNKSGAPSLLLHEFNYYFNKAINQWCNKSYNTYDVNLQSSDNLRVLKATTILTPKKAVAYGAGASKLFGATYEVVLPDDYLHMLNCVCIYKMAKTHKCYDKGDYVDFAAKRLTADSWSVIINDYYNRPLPERPYYYIHNVNQASTQTNPVKADGTGTDMVGIYKVTPGSKEETAILAGKPEIIADDQKTGSNFNRTITIGGTTTSVVEREAAYRYGNASKVRCEIRYGCDDSVYLLEKVFIDYMKAPLTIRLTQEQVNLTEDTSQIMEFPDYVCQEIINELVSLILLRNNDPRLQTLKAVTLSIAPPVQQLTPQQK